jgi:hypothetical protein
MSSGLSRARHRSSVLAPCWWRAMRVAERFSGTTVKGPSAPGVGGRVSVSEGSWATEVWEASSEGAWVSGASGGVVRKSARSGQE